MSACIAAGLAIGVDRKPTVVTKGGARRVPTVEKPVVLPALEVDVPVVVVAVVA
jgi:hypothetical protein